MPAKKSRDAAVTRLRSVLSQLQMRTPAGSVSPAVLNNVVGLVEEAIDLIQETDPLKKRVAFIVLALQESTELHVVALRGKDHERILIRDRPLYEWAMKQVHELTRVAA
ncbi:hypothetical protein ACFVUR_09345 [Stenotrophomonas bentonitica]|uniref:hypothetical protein n=1 Tax=Stenotrophomonas bentonitica TaxID=1450134 RepID=UPI0036EDDC4F